MTDAEILRAAVAVDHDHPGRIRAEHIIGGPRDDLPDWWQSLLTGADKHRLDIVLDDRSVFRIGITIDGVRAMNGEHDVLRHADGRFEVVERGDSS